MASMLIRARGHNEKATFRRGQQCHSAISRWVCCAVGLPRGPSAGHTCICGLMQVAGPHRKGKLRAKLCQRK